MVSSILENSAGLRWVARNLTQSCVLGLALGASFVTQTYAEGVDASVLQQEVTKRSEQLILGQELLLKGDESYKNAQYKEAVEQYAQAFSLIPNGELSREVKLAASQRYAQAAVEHCKTLVRTGDYQEARVILNKVLSPEIAQGHKGAQQMLDSLDDPLKVNPALTTEHTRDAEAVGKWLRKAEGFYNLAKFDEATTAYEEVLLIDPYNQAARRGMERVSAQKSEYAKAARDQARAELLMEVESEWELKPSPALAKFNNASDLEILPQEVNGNKLRQIIVPVVDFQDISITEAYDMVRIWAKENDSQTVDEDAKGVNFVLNIGGEDTDWGKRIRNKRINLSLRNVPLNKVLDFISKSSGTQWKNDGNLVVVTPTGESDKEIRHRSFRVPPTFLQAAANQTTEDDDPFAEKSSTSGAIASRVSAKEFLESLGVSFPEGSSAKYIAGRSTLMVANTQQNLDLIETQIAGLAQTESAQVVLKMTIMDVARTDLEELGFDWLLGTRGEPLILGGGTQGSDGEIANMGTLSEGFTPVTSGLRSGDSMFKGDVLGALIGEAPALSRTPERAPGVLTMTTPTVQAFFRGLDQLKNLDRLETPSLIARSGEKATLFNGREFIYPTEYEPPEIPRNVGSTSSSRNGRSSSPITPSHPTAFETRLVGVSLEAEAVVSADKNYVDVNIVSDISRFDGFIDYGSPISSIGIDSSGDPTRLKVSDNSILMPVFSNIPLTASVTVQDGSTIMLASLNKSSIEKVEDKVPVLGDMPLVGRLFRSEGIKKTDRATIILINVELKDPTGKNWRDR